MRENCRCTLVYKDDFIEAIKAFKEDVLVADEIIIDAFSIIGSESPKRFEVLEILARDKCKG